MGENKRNLPNDNVADQEEGRMVKSLPPPRPAPPAPPPPRRGEQSATVNIESNNPSDRKTTVTVQVRLRTSGQRVRQGKVYPINKTWLVTYYVTMVGDVMTIVQESKGERSRHQCGRERQINSIAMDNGVTAMPVTCSYVQQGDVYTATWAGKFTDTRMKLGDRGSHNGELRFSSNSQGCKIL